MRVGARAELCQQGRPDATIFVLLPEEQAKLGIAMPADMFGRIIREGRAPYAARLVRTSDSDQVIPQADAGLPELRVERGGLSELRDGLGEPAPGLQAAADHGVYRGIVGEVAEDHPELLERLVMSTNELERDGE